MKRLVIIAAMGVIVQKTNAQAFKVGDINCNHSIINHTFTTSCPGSVSSDNQAYGFDIDGDMVNDITVSSWCFKSGSSSAGSGNGFDVSGSAGIEFAQNITPNTGLENLAYGSPINSHSTWGTIGIIYRYVFSFTNNILIGQQVNPFYVGFRKILSNDTIFGWVQTNSILPGQVFSYGYKSVSDSVTSPITPTITATPTIVCASDSLNLTATPSGGYFYGPGVSGNTFYSASLTPGNYSVLYCMIPSPVACSGKTTQTISVSACTGINELQVENSLLGIFPNPNNGEFLIKGTKEETIFISNELGQLINTIHLNSQNNYSIKINDLQSGVYFVGNKLSRQKIVVIK